MDECPMDLGAVQVSDLESALTCFPAAESMELRCLNRRGNMLRVKQLLLRHGRTLKRFCPYGEGAHLLLDYAVRVGALPSLKYFRFCFYRPADVKLLSEWRWASLEEVCLVTSDSLKPEEEHGGMSAAAAPFSALPLSGELRGIRTRHPPVHPAIAHDPQA
jgi:hypothetical protein